MARNSGRSFRTISVDADAPARGTTTSSSRGQRHVQAERHHDAADAHDRRRDHQRERHQGHHLDLLDVVGGAGDQRGRPELAHLARREGAAPGRTRAARRSRPRRHRRCARRSRRHRSLHDDLEPARCAIIDGRRSSGCSPVSPFTTPLSMMSRVQAWAGTGWRRSAGTAARTSRAMGLPVGPEIGPQKSYEHACLSESAVGAAVRLPLAPIVGHSPALPGNRLTRRAELRTAFRVRQALASYRRLPSAYDRNAPGCVCSRCHELLPPAWPTSPGPRRSAPGPARPPPCQAGGLRGSSVPCDTPSAQAACRRRSRVAA